MSAGARRRLRTGLRYSLAIGLGVAATAGHALTLRVSDALPVRGQALRLTTDAAQPATVSVADAAGARDLGTVQPGAELRWTPTALGPASLVARVGEQRSEARTVFVTPRRLQFNYWSCPPNQRWVTSKLLGKGETAESWLARGVKPLAWKYGLAHPTWTEAASWVDHWTTELSGTPGVMIDEFGAGDAKDQVMGQALTQARAAKPDLFLAPYCLGARGDAMVAGLKASDLVLVEIYVGDWRGYGAFDDRMASAAAACPDTAIAVLGLRDWATTHLEIRRQIEYLRSTRPQMPGIGFFHTPTPRLMAAVDRAVYDYFLGPAIQVTRDAGGATLRNIGCLPATGVRARVGEAEQVVPTIDVDQTVRLAGADIHLVPMAGRYTVVDWQDPTKLPPPTGGDNAAGTAWRARFAKVEPLPDPAGLSLLRVPADADRQAGAKGQIEGAKLPLAAAHTGPLQLAFTLDLARAHFYGTCGLALEGKGSLGLRWSHGDNDRDVPANQPRLVLECRGSGGDLARETCPVALGPERRFKLVVGYDPQTGARAQLLTAESRLLWDSGNLPVDSPLELSALRFEVTPWAGSEVRAEGAIWRLRGVSGGPEPSPYVLESAISELALRSGPMPRFGAPPALAGPR